MKLVLLLVLRSCWGTDKLRAEGRGLIAVLRLPYSIAQMGFSIFVGEDAAD